ncbi:MAG: SPOR domain-containing protein [Campylobacterota bacterium]|nr:SPOR domain-containing protein [Campylobacterota bacterium]
MKDHNLDDLIIDDIEPKQNKGKGLLTIVALLIAILIVAIVMTRLFLGDGDESTTVPDQKQEEMISPELKLDTSDQDLEADKKELEQLSSMMEDELSEKSEKTETVSQPAAPKEEIKPETAQIDEAVAPVAPVPVQEKAPKPVEVVEEKPVQEVVAPAPVEQTPVVKKEASPAAKPAETQQKAVGTYYIQVGAFSKEPSKQFLSVITKSGFHYKLSKGKLLIGPYSSREAASRDLPKVKDRINKQAFIKQL